MKRWSSLVFCGLMSCGSTAGPAGQSCPDEQPQLASCFNGDFFSDCGGIGEPAFGCDASGEDCRWFSGGCPAQGYTLSSCDAENICCVDNFPFSQDRFADPSDAGRLGLEFHGRGSEPWDRTRAVNVDVVTDPDVQRAQPFWCDGEVPWPPTTPTPCTGWIPNDAGQILLADTLVIRPLHTELLGWTPNIEIVPDADGNLKARVCTFPKTDDVSSMCGTIAAGIRCAEAGTITINAWPESEDDLEDVVVNIEADFGDFTLHGSFQTRLPSPGRFCPEGQPAIEDCFEGSFFADCGGIGPPTFACSEPPDRNELADCRWFTGGCPAQGYTPSWCEADNLCCIDSFPFPPNTFGGDTTVDLYLELYGWGRKLWDRERDVTMATVIDAEVDASEPLTCTGDAPDQSLCTRGETFIWVRQRDTLEINLSPGPDAGQLFTIEVIPQDDGTYAARTCIHRYTDAAMSGACPEVEPIECASSGTVILDRWPTSQADAEGLTGTIFATFDTFTLSGGFQDPIPEQ